MPDDYDSASEVVEDIVEEIPEEFVEDVSPVTDVVLEASDVIEIIEEIHDSYVSLGGGAVDSFTPDCGLFQPGQPNTTSLGMLNEIEKSDNDEYSDDEPETAGKSPQGPELDVLSYSTSSSSSLPSSADGAQKLNSAQRHSSTDCLPPPAPVSLRDSFHRRPQEYTSHDVLTHDPSEEGVTTLPTPSSSNTNDAGGEQSCPDETATSQLQECEEEEPKKKGTDWDVWHTGYDDPLEAQDNVAKGKGKRIKAREALAPSQPSKRRHDDWRRDPLVQRRLQAVQRMQREQQETQERVIREQALKHRRQQRVIRELQERRREAQQVQQEEQQRLAAHIEATATRLGLDPTPEQPHLPKPPTPPTSQVSSTKTTRRVAPLVPNTNNPRPFLPNLFKRRLCKPGTRPVAWH